MEATEKGRADLAAWVEDQPRNFYQADPCLAALNAAGWSAAELERRRGSLLRFGEQCAGPLDAAAMENNLHRNLPVLDAYDGIGRRAEPVVHHPSYDAAGRIIYGSGVMAAYGEDPEPHRYILSLFYLSSHAGEAGHNCPLACTAGAIRALKRLGTEDQKARYLPGLLNPDWDTNFSGAQLLTEVQGGSDVGSNAVTATPEPDGSWRIDGEKWFCSNVGAEVILMTARPAGAPPDTRGLGLFLVPAIRPDDTRNTYRARRLKDKLGTRSMASAELDFEGVYAEALGPPEAGFRNVMELVINTSRLYNAFSVTGLAHRAYLVAEGYARHRRAFDAPISHYPLVQETLAGMLADSEASLAGSYLLAGLQERMERGEASEDERAFSRVALNVNKLRTAALAHGVINSGIEVLGGNGTIESFSVLPRLLRDNIVCENWEGTHNTLRLQVLRDCKRMGLHQGFFRYLRSALDPGLVDPVERLMGQALDAPPELATLLMRPAADQMATLVHLAGLAPLRDERVQLRSRLTELRHLRPPAPADAGYLKLVRDCWEAHER